MWETPWRRDYKACCDALKHCSFLRSLKGSLRSCKSSKVIRKFQRLKSPSSRGGRTIADDFAAFLAELLPGLDVPLLHFKGGCSGSGYTEMGGCWEPALLWEMLKQPAPGAAHTINIPGTGGVPQTILRNVWAGIQEQEFTGGRNLSDLSKPLQW